ncbi:MAG TPA: 1,4-dihydroxy-6-naphthoate synthase [Chitinophagaceae bacterium]|jgi:1,4-dihydroxy-6-naphthoate synthase
MKLTLGFSPCPNDTFIFDALVNKKIDTEGLEFDVVLEDVQTLNEWAIRGNLDITKLSYGVLPLVLNHYRVISAGGALGKGVGPLLIAKEQWAEGEGVQQKKVAIPGENTTAHLLFSLAYPEAKDKKFMLFSGIEDAVINRQVDGGVIIHENRFTYQKRGLVKLAELGEYWEEKTQSPIPLGGIVVKQSFDAPLRRQLNALIRKSIEYAFGNYPFIADYVKEHSQEMEESVMRQHIDLYVNNYSIDLGKEGRRAVMKLLEVYRQLHLGKNFKEEDIFA